VVDPQWDSPVWTALTEIADRVIVDGRTWRAPLAELDRFVAAVTTPQPPIAYTDLLWTALTPWRRFTAQCFDMPTARAQLAHLDRVSVTHGPAESDRLAALLLVGWLGSRLGWTIAGNEPLAMQAGSRRIAIDIQTRSDGSGVQQLVLGSHHAEIALHTLSGSSCVQSTIRLPQIAPIERVAAMGTQALEQLVGEELDMLDRDRGFEAALAIAAHLATISARA
jgi:glucose-6-phosphate dehydrogenase assembly protein OpcA